MKNYTFSRSIETNARHLEESYEDLEALKGLYPLARTPRKELL
jgi:hypothetical protein